MTRGKRLLVGLGLAGVVVGFASWMLVGYVVRPAPGENAASGGTTRVRVPGESFIKVSLFYVAADGLRLTPVERDVPFADGTSEQAKRILEAQLMPPPSPLLAAIPNGTTLRGIYVADRGEAYVDFGDAIRTAHPGGSLQELFTVYSIVSVLTVNLPAIKSVQILINSHEVDTLAGHVDLRRPLPRSAIWLEPPTIVSAR